MTTKSSSLISILVVFTLSLQIQRVSANSFSLTDITPPPSTEFFLTVINDNGQIAGNAYDLQSDLQSCLYWQNGVSEFFAGLYEINPLSLCVVYGMNNNGQIVGRNDDEEGILRAFLWQDGVTTDFLSLPQGYGSEALSIIDNGQIVGRVYIPTSPGVPDTGFEPHGFVWEDGVMTQLPCQAIAVDNNNLGQVLAYNESNCNPGSFWYRGMIWQNGQITNLDFNPFKINNNWQVIGRSPTTEEFYFWDNGVRTLLPTSFYPLDLNDNGLVVGFLRSVDGDSAALLEDGMLTDLGEIAGANISRALSINNSRQIVGYTITDGVRRSVMWQKSEGNTPVGTNVVVSIGSGTEVFFVSVSSAGDTSVSSSNTGPAAPSGFNLGDTPTYYDVTTSATYEPPVSVCIGYDPFEYANIDLLRLLHYEDGAWVDVTSSHDEVEHVICGQVNSLSPFVVAQELYSFSGFFQPVENLPIVNVVNAGMSIPVKFSLEGYQGMAIFDAGYPKT